MRQIFLLSLLYYAFSLNGQATIDSLNGKIYLESVHEIELSKTELKDWSERWVAKSYNNSNYVTRINNEDNILTKGSFEVGAKYSFGGITTYAPQTVNYTLDIKFKEGRYKIEIDDLSLSANGISTDISAYYMDKQQYKAYMLSTMDNYDGLTRSTMTKWLNNDRKLSKYHSSTQEYWSKLEPQIIETIESIDQSLLSYLKNSANEDDEDW